MTQFFAVLAVFGMACLVWLAYGWLLLPGRCRMELTVIAEGSGEGLEQTVRWLNWLRRSGLLAGEVRIRDGGLNRAGLQLALEVARQNNITFCGKQP